MIKITWKTAVGASSYEIWRAVIDDTSAATKIGETAGNTYRDSDVVAGSGTYYYWVRSKKGATLSSFGSSTGPIVAGDFFAEPQNVLSTQDEEDQVTLTWDRVTGAL